MEKISLIVPAYNEEQSLQFFYKEVRQVFNELDFELIFINDGSQDKTAEILENLASKDEKVKVCHLSRNFGQQASILCGLAHAKGDAVIVMDADLQDPPSVALQMIEKWKEGYAIVHGKRKKRAGESFFKKATADLFYAFTRKITGLDLPSNVGDFKLYDRKVVDTLLSMPEHDRMIRIQAVWMGFKQAFIEFERPKRIAGTSHYTFKKMVSLAKAGVFPNTDFTATFPLKLGIFCTICSSITYIIFIILSCFNVAFGGLIAWLFPTIAFATGLILIGQGISNIQTNMIYKETQNRPIYIVEKTNNL